MTGRAAVPSPLRILVGSTPGSVPDLVARRIAERLGREDRVVLVDNRMGAAGRLAINALRSAPADGTTLLLAPGAIATMYPAIYAQPGYDAQADLLPVSTARRAASGPGGWCRGTGFGDIAARLRRVGHGAGFTVQLWLPGHRHTPACFGRPVRTPRGHSVDPCALCRRAASGQ